MHDLYTTLHRHLHDADVVLAFVLAFMAGRDYARLPPRGQVLDEYDYHSTKDFQRALEAAEAADRKHRKSVLVVAVMLTYVTVFAMRLITKG